MGLQPIELVVLIALAAHGLNIAMSAGNVLHPYAKLLRHLPLWMAKPLGECVHCTAGSTITILVMLFILPPIWVWVVVSLGSVALVEIIDYLMDRL